MLPNCHNFNLLREIDGVENDGDSCYRIESGNTGRCVHA